MLRAVQVVRRAGAASPLRLAQLATPRSAAVRCLSAGPHPSEVFLSGTNAVYMEEMYRLWKQNPGAVHASWDVYFRNVDAGLAPGKAFQAPPSIQPGLTAVPTGAAGGAAGVGSTELQRITHLIRAYQVRGYDVANLDPLGLHKPPAVAELDISQYGFSEADLDREFDLGGLSNVHGFLADTKRTTLRLLIERLRATYCSTVGYDYMHIQSREKCNWIRERIEVDRKPLSRDEKLKIYEWLVEAEEFEGILGLKYGAQKRFGLDGTEAMIPGTKALIEQAVSQGVSGFVLGMPHRGRLNVLTNVMGKPYAQVYKEFDDVMKDISGTAAAWSGTGDVKYHKGASVDLKIMGSDVHMTLVANPSHLEAVNPVVLGKARAKQDEVGADGGKSVMGILFHGDAAFAGQGIVYETMQFCRLPAYATAGTIHIVVNNQIGYTTDPMAGRSTPHCTDIGKTFQVPIFHVNADDVEAVVRVCKLAAEYRAAFQDDCIIDLVGYRRYGHNEADAPMFTQPEMYAVIAKHQSTLKLYRAQLLKSGELSEADLKAVDERLKAHLLHEYDHRNEREFPPIWLGDSWKGLKPPTQYAAPQATGIPRGDLEALGKQIASVPAGFTLHPNIDRQLKKKFESIVNGRDLDWATAEGLAFASLLKQGMTVRLTGQDVERGTFSHRHATLHDQKTFQRFSPLTEVAKQYGSRVTIANSPLSEYGVLGFELGYSMESPRQLVLWEAQFGDFVNGAQIIIDQFLSAGEQKWLRQSGLVLLLPHGYDGAGPEHSSCRIERFLQNSDDPEHEILPQELMHQRTNWQIVNCSTPANYFHALRRQVMREFRKPLIVMSPKSLLRLPECSSSLADFESGKVFQKVIPESGTGLVKAQDVRKLVLCSGKVYYDLVNARKERQINDVAISRLEQISPFPFEQIAQELAKYPNAHVVWCQEEPRNMGAWTHVRPRVETAGRVLNKSHPHIHYAGRAPSAATACGSASQHKREQKALLDAALS